jgi:hypothetical protein
MNIIDTAKVGDMVLSKILSDHPADAKLDFNFSRPGEEEFSGSLDICFVFNDENLVSERFSVSAVGRSMDDVAEKLIDSFNRIHGEKIGVLVIVKRNFDGELYVSGYADATAVNS